MTDNGVILPLPVPGLRILHHNDSLGRWWSSTVLGVSEVHNGRTGEVSTEVFTLHEAGKTLGYINIKYWPGPFFLRVLGPKDLVVGEGVLAGRPWSDALEAVIARYRLSDTHPAVRLLNQHRLGGCSNGTP